MQWRWFRQLTIGRVVLLLPLVAIFIGSRSTIRDNSFLWHIQAGELQLERGSVLTSDPFSFIAQGERWRTQSWIADLLYGFFERLSPLSIGSWVTGISAALLVGFATLRAYRRGTSTFVAGVVGLWVMWLSLGWFSPRPVVISLALFSAFAVVAEDRRLRWAIPLMIWLWASVHGGFVVGLGFLVLLGLARRDRTYMRDAAVSLVAASLTAHGWGTWEVLISFLGGSGALDSITEWANPDLFGLALMPFLAVIVAMVVCGKRQEIERGALWIIVPFLLFAFTASRSVPIATVALVPWLAAFLRPLSRFLSGGSGNLVTLTVGLLAVSIPWLLPIESGLDPSRFPIEAAKHLTEDRVFHDDGTGGFLIYSQYPERLVYIDDRAELFKDRFVEFGEARAGQPVWRKVFNQLDFQQVLLKKDAPLVQILSAEGWRERFADETFIVLDR